MVGGVDLLHFYLCVHVAVIHEVHISSFHLADEEIRCPKCISSFLKLYYYCLEKLSILYLRYTVDISDDFDDVVKW